MAFDPYRILDVPRDAGPDEIRTAFRELARRYHPDLNPGREAEEFFKLVDYAYSVLSDPDRRALYDAHGDLALRLGFDAGRIAAASRPRSPRDRDGLSDVLGGARVTRPPPDPPSDSADLVVPLRVDRALAARGGPVKVASPLGGAVVTVQVPAGARDGTRIRLPGRGPPRTTRGRPGDLYVEIRIKDGP